jgi:hypothetical protein
VWAAFAPVIAAVVAGLIAAAALWQKRRADNRSEWWRRTQWALDASFDEDPERQAMGLAVLEVLADSRMVTNEEIRIVEEAWRDPLEEEESALDDAGGMPENEARRDAEESET